MAINQNHSTEDLNSVKCAVVETHVSRERAEFLKALLNFNKYTVEIAPSPPPKAAAPKPPATAEAAAPAEPDSFTVGVTDLMFNPVNAIYGRLLHTPDGHVVTPAYWQQKETTSHDEIPYYEKKR